VSEFTTVEGGPRAETRPEGASTPAKSIDTGNTMTTGNTTISGNTTTAILRGGPASGKKVSVPRIAGTFPVFLGVDGGNYVRDKGAGDHAVYNWWPAGASAPAGDPTARANAR
jgi:hypothetical protein